MKRFFLAFILAVCSLTVAAQSPTPGTDMPRAIFYKSDGSNFYTDRIPKGSKSLLMLFDATCEHCQKVASNLSKRSKELAGANLYLISQDELRSINYFMDNFAKPLQHMKNVTVLQDRDHVFIPMFHPKQYPALYLYGEDKKLDFYSSSERDLPRFINRIKSR